MSEQQKAIDSIDDVVWSVLLQPELITASQLTGRFRDPLSALQALRSGRAAVRGADSRAAEAVVAFLAQHGLAFHTEPGFTSILRDVTAAIQSGNPYELIHRPEQCHEETFESWENPYGHEVGPYDGVTPPTNFAGTYNPEPPTCVTRTVKVVDRIERVEVVVR
jgi:hypothetical protein